MKGIFDPSFESLGSKSSGKGCSLPRSTKATHSGEGGRTEAERGPDSGGRRSPEVNIALTELEAATLRISEMAGKPTTPQKDTPVRVPKTAEEVPG